MRGRLLSGRLHAGRLFGGEVPPAVIAPDFFPAGHPRQAKKSPRLRRFAASSVWLSVPCTVSASAGLRLGVTAAVDGEISLKTEAGIRLTANAEMSLTPSVESTADMHDVVLEMMLLLD